MDINSCGVRCKRKSFRFPSQALSGNSRCLVVGALSWRNFIRRMPGMLLLAISAVSAADPLARSLPQLRAARATLRPARAQPVVCAPSTMCGAAETERAPSVGALVGFAVPLLGIGLASPLLGLVDTAVVGRCAGSLQLAALAPSVALCDITFYLFRGLGATTTAFVAAADADADDTRACLLYTSPSPRDS